MTLEAVKSVRCRRSKGRNSLERSKSDLENVSLDPAGGSEAAPTASAASNSTSSVNQEQSTATEELSSGKRTLSNSSQEDEDKRLKFKNTDTDSPARAVSTRSLSKTTLLRPSKLNVIGTSAAAEEADTPLSSPPRNKNLIGSKVALGNMTNSPIREPKPNIKSGVNPNLGVVTKTGASLLSGREKRGIGGGGEGRWSTFIS